jgi:hypothetical protein
MHWMAAFAMEALKCCLKNGCRVLISAAKSRDFEVLVGQARTDGEKVQNF